MWRYRARATSASSVPLNSSLRPLLLRLYSLTSLSPNLHDDTTSSIENDLLQVADTIASMRRSCVISQAHPQFSIFTVISSSLPQPWWETFATLSMKPIEIELRSLPCPNCSTLLLKDEQLSWCCKNGRISIQRLPSYPPDFQSLLQRNLQLEEFCRLSRSLNYLFTFSSISVSGGFAKLLTPSNVAVTGRVYHRIYDINAG